MELQELHEHPPTPEWHIVEVHSTYQGNQGFVVHLDLEGDPCGKVLNKVIAVIGDSEVLLDLGVLMVSVV